MPEIVFNGPEGRLEGRYQHGAPDNPPIALLLHPHPQYGGSMNNKVVYTLFRVFTRLGFSALRFNFRGVGRSEGRYDEGVGEMSDAPRRWTGSRATTPTRAPAGSAVFRSVRGLPCNCSCGGPRSRAS